MLAWSPGVWVVALADASGRFAGAVYVGEDLAAARWAAALADAGIHTHVECQWAETSGTCGFGERAQPARDATAKRAYPR